MCHREVATLVNEYKQAEAYKSNFNASGLSSGVYLYQLRAGNFVETKKQWFKSNSLTLLTVSGGIYRVNV